MRLRGQYREARDLALKIVNAHPENVAAHALLGDIAAEQDDLAQAAEWYEMAVDLDSEADNERRKLHSIQQRMREREAADTAAQLGLPTSKPKALRFALITAAFIVVVGVGAFLAGDRFQARADSTRSTGLLEESVSLPSPESLETEASPPLATPAPQPTERVAPMTTGPAVPERPRQDRESLARMREQTQGGERVTSAIQDPRYGGVMVTVRANEDENPRLVAAQMAVAALDVFVGAPSATVRVVTNDEIVFVADVMREDLGAARRDDPGVNQPVIDPLALLRNEWTPTTRASATP